MTVRQRGWSRRLNRPWRSKKRAKVAAGIWVKVLGPGDQIDEPRGTRYQSRNPADQRCVLSTSSRVTSSGGGSSSRPLARRLKRATSASIRQEGGPGEVAPLGEHGRGRGAPPLEAGTAVGDAEAHVARLGGHAEPVEETAEQRVGALVVDEEAGVDVHGGVVQLDPVGVASVRRDDRRPRRGRRHGARAAGGRRQVPTPRFR